MKSTALMLAGALLGLASVSRASADNFRTLPVGSSPAGWVPYGAAAWSIVNDGTSQFYQAEGPSLPGPFASTRAVDLAKDAGFSLSTTFRITGGTSHPAGEYIGLVAFATQPNLAASSYYLADVQCGSGIVRIVSLGAENPDYALTLVALPITDGASRSS